MEEKEAKGCQPGNNELKPNMILDRVGEKTDLSLCPVCTEHPDCHACMDGRCTALKVVDETASCCFYKSFEQSMTEMWRGYQRLKEEGRSDLITKYIKPLSALGLLDDEIKTAEQYGEQFEHFRESNYQEQLEKFLNPEMDDDLLEEANFIETEVDDVDEEEEDEEDEYAGVDSWDDGWS